MIYVPGISVIASLTTIPSRIDHIRPVLLSALNQTVKIEKVEINIPLVCGRTGEEYLIPDWLIDMRGVEIFRTEDYGPITKIAPTLLRHSSRSDLYVWAIDDDCAYPSDQLEVLLKGFSPDESRILVRYGGALNSGHDFQNWYGEGLVSFFEGFGGVLYPPNSVGKDFDDYVKITSDNQDCRRSDDIVLSMYFNNRNIPIYLYNHPDAVHPYLVEGWLKHAGTDALSEGGHREKYGRAFEFVRGLLKSSDCPQGDLASVERALGKLELGCGMSPTDGYTHHDRVLHSDHVEIAHDLNVLPWPWADNSLGEILALDVFEHLHLMPEQWLRECHRILAPGAVLHLRVPIFGSPWHTIDPTHVRGFDPLNFEFFIHGRPYWEKHGHYYFDFSFRDGEIWTESYNIIAKLKK